MPFFYFDVYYIYLILPALIISIIAQMKVKSTFSKYSNMHSGVTGAAAAEQVLHAHGVYNVSIERVAGNLTDHFDPRTNVIRLSESVYDSQSVSAVGVAAHEAGHAVQYAENYAPIRLRNKIVPVVNFGSSISWIVLILGVLLSMPSLLWLGIALFSLSTVFHLITLPVELNASNRAMKTITERNLLNSEDEVRGARKVLSAAAMTYVAALLVSLAQLLRIVMLFGNRRR